MTTHSATMTRHGLLVLAAGLAGCGGGGGGGGGSDPAWYYHFACNGDSQCASLNPTNGTSGSLNQGTGAPGQTNCNSLLTFGNINWNIPPAQQACSQSPTPPSPAITLSVTPTAIELGQSAALTWSSSNAASCTASNAWTGPRSIDGTQNVTPTAAGIHTYTLGCTGFGITTSRSVTLTVNAPTVSISLAPSTITDGGSSTLTWSTTRTSACTASGAWSGPTALSGSRQVSPSTGSFSYTLTCTGTGGSIASNSATLTVNPSPTLQSPPTVAIAVTPGTVNNSQTSELSWSTSRASVCTAGGSWSGEQPLSGTLTLPATAQGHYEYSLTCNGSGGSASAVAVRTVTGTSVICGPPSVSIGVAPTSVVEGEAATLSWSATPAPSCSLQSVSCTAEGAWSGDVADSGTLGLAPSAGTFTYVLNCRGRNATVSRSATLTVAASATPPASSVDVTLSPSAINLGDSTVLSWTSNGVRSCSASGAWSGVQSLSGSRVLTPGTVGAHAYTLTCQGSNASAADTATLSVQSAAGTTASARFDHPSGLVVDSSGNILVADTNNHVIRQITPGNAVTTVAGLADNAGSADGTGAIARFNGPQGIAVAADGTFYLADSGSHTLRAVSPAAAVTTPAGLAGSAGSGDGTGAAARLNSPFGVAVDSAGNILVADTANHTIRKITSTGVVTTLAGMAGVTGSADGTGAAARFNSPRGIAVDSSDNLYVADHGNYTVRKITSGGVVTTLAGTAGAPITVGNGDGTGSGARFAGPGGVATDSAGNVYVSDINGSNIRKITPDGVVTTFAGAFASPGSADGTGTSAQFRAPAGIAVDASDNLYVADTFNCTIRKITPAAVVTTIAGQALNCGSTN